MRQKSVLLYCPPSDRWPNFIAGLEQLVIVEISVVRGQSVEPGQELALVRSDEDSLPWPIKLTGFQGLVEEVLISRGQWISPKTCLLKLLVEDESLRQVSTQHSLLGAAGNWASRVRDLAKKESNLRRKLHLDKNEKVPDSYFTREELETFRRFEQHTQWFLERYLFASCNYAAKHPLLSRFDPQSRDEILSDLPLQIHADWNRGAVLIAWEDGKDDVVKDGNRRFRHWFRKRVEYNLLSVIKAYCSKSNRHATFDETSIPIMDIPQVENEAIAPEDQSSILEMLSEIDKQIELWIKQSMKTRGEQEAVKVWRWMELARSGVSISDQIKVVVSQGLYPTDQAAERDRRRKLSTAIVVIAQNLEFLPMAAGNNDIVSVMSAAVNYVFLKSGYQSISIELIRNSLERQYGAFASVE